MKSSDTKSREQIAKEKARFDFLRKRTYGQGQHPVMGSPFHGKNKSQRQRLSAAFSLFRNSKNMPWRAI